MPRRFCCIWVLGWCRWRAALSAFGCRVASFRRCVRWTKGAIFETVQRVFPSSGYALLSIGGIFGRNFIIGERYLV